MRHNTQTTAGVDSEILSLEAVYCFRDRATIVSFLREHLFLIDLLTEATGEIREHFGRQAQLALEVFRDVDDPSAAELLVWIRTNLEPGVARRELDRFDEDWWLEASARSDTRMNIALEYSYAV